MVQKHLSTSKLLGKIQNLTTLTLIQFRMSSKVEGEISEISLTAIYNVATHRPYNSGSPYYTTRSISKFKIDVGTTINSNFHNFYIKDKSISSSSQKEFGIQMEGHHEMYPVMNKQ